MSPIGYGAILRKFVTNKTGLSYEPGVQTEILHELCEASRGKETSQALDLKQGSYKGLPTVNRPAYCPAYPLLIPSVTDFAKLMARAERTLKPTIDYHDVHRTHPSHPSVSPHTQQSMKCGL